LDTLAPADAEAWLDQELRPLLLSFQDEYEGQAGLILWLPAGKQRVTPFSEPPLRSQMTTGRSPTSTRSGSAGSLLESFESQCIGLQGKRPIPWLADSTAVAVGAEVLDLPNKKWRRLESNYGPRDY
jgi:hypothetical protein